MREELTSCCAPNRTGKQAAGSGTNKTCTEKKETDIRFKDKMVQLNGGTFLMGTDSREGFLADGEGPVRERSVKSFWMDRHAVTNAEFGQFVKETGYRTEAEKFGWSFVFYQFIPQALHATVQQVAATPWWCAVGQAYWLQPEGPGSSVEDRMDHPVVHISWNDAQSFCGWAGKRLPTETEWEYAARGGLAQKKYPWGDDLTPNGEHYCNIWQGKFPAANTRLDGHLATAPARSFPPNGFGLYQMAGNVWEWCENLFTENQETEEPDFRRAMRGGSYLCHESYCNRYRVAARTSNTPDSSSGNIGFRCAAD